MTTAWLDHIGLLGGPVARAIEVAAAASLLGALVSRNRQWRLRVIPTLVVAAAAITVGAAIALRRGHVITDHYPRSFLVWAAAPVLAAINLPLGIAARAGWRRAIAVAALPLTLCAALLLINDQYGYYPTVGSAMGRDVPLQVEPAVLQSELVAPPPGPMPRNGQVAPLDIPAPVSRFPHRSGAIYLPPAFFATPRPALPVVVMLGGTPGSPWSWLRSGGAADTADAVAARNNGVAPILVFVDQNSWFMGDSECVDGPRGRAETYLTQDVPQYLQRTFGVSTNPEHWAIAGFSEGGTCALTLTLRHPDTYTHFIDLAGDAAPAVGSPRRTLHELFGGSVVSMRAHDPRRLLTQHYTDVTGWFSAGEKDTAHLVVASQQAEAATAAGVRVHTNVFEGGHTWRFAGQAFKSLLGPLTDDLIANPSARLGWTRRP